MLACVLPLFFKQFMKKQILTMVIAGAAVLAYIAIRKKYSKSNNQPAPEPRPLHEKQHHLTNAFANAKKHAMHTSNGK